MSHTLALPEIVEAPPAEDPFRYGTRFSRRRMPDGSYELIHLPLTLWDVLHPQEGDYIVQSQRHQAEVNYLADAIRARLASDEHALVLSDCGIFWDTPGLTYHAPDVAVIFDVEQPDQVWPSFHVKGQGVWPSMILEVVTPGDTRANDVVTKFIEYHKAGVPTYIIIDRKKEDDWPTIRAYRAGPEKYEPLALDDRDCLLLPGIGLRLCSNQNRVVLYDANTGEEVGDYAAITEALEAEAAARKKAEEQAREAREQARLAEQARQKADEARQKADDRLAAEQAARADLERELRELKENLQGGGS